MIERLVPKKFAGTILSGAIALTACGGSIDIPTIDCGKAQEVTSNLTLNTGDKFGLSSAFTFKVVGPGELQFGGESNPFTFYPEDHVTIRSEASQVEVPHSDGITVNPDNSISFIIKGDLYTIKANPLANDQTQVSISADCD